MMGGFYAWMLQFVQWSQCHHNAPTRSLVEDYVAAGRRMGELFYAILGAFNGFRCSAPKYTAGFESENV
jgi:hypothetical protein